MTTEREAFEKWFEGKNPFLHRFETDAFFAGYQAGRAALLAEMEPMVQVVAVGQYEFPHLEWLSADHSLRYKPVYTLYRLPTEK